ncbi:hypothetical protein PVAND_004495 [Polypedilum vanderplanki]|uniref:Ubiquitin regulatory protein n=1 Tax=Polypedilum vanderplanki TaxID=319348 RepID=A0A9J6BYA7_POLVA|nr:hypothetical protein PVAND_004495 [Polypedilum vanderplanki]
MSGIEQLVEMGFPRDRAEKALSCNNNNVEQAMEWLLVHSEDDMSNVNPPNEPKPLEIKNDESSNEPAANATTSESDQAIPQEAKSIKCEDCGKLFKTTIEIEFHAAKSGHSNFSESTEEKKPLTEEEKKAQLAQLEERIKAKRLEREEREKQEALEKERLRIKSGKDMSEARRKLEEEEMKKIVEQRKREKQEEKIARERVKAQIEADKAARRAKAAGQPPSISEPVQVPVQTPQVTPPPKDYKETKIQIRLPNGSTLVETFDKREQLSAVRLFIQLKQGDEPGTFPFGMMTNFPRKVFTEEDYEKSLDELKLVPSAVIIVTKTA